MKLLLVHRKSNTYLEQDFVESEPFLHSLCAPVFAESFVPQSAFVGQQAFTAAESLGGQQAFTAAESLGGRFCRTVCFLFRSHRLSV